MLQTTLTSQTTAKTPRPRLTILDDTSTSRLKFVLGSAGCLNPNLLISVSFATEMNNVRSVENNPTTTGHYFHTLNVLGTITEIEFHPGIVSPDVADALVV